MAYFDPSLAPPAGLQTVSTAPARRVAGTLTPIEEAVLDLARRDGPASLVSPGPLGRRLRRLFGLEGPNPLADPRLEALRRFAVLLVRHGDAAADTGEAGLIAAGFSPLQIAYVRRRLGWLVSRRRRRTARVHLATLAVPLAGGAGWMHHALTATLGDPLIALVLLIAITLPLAPLAAGQ